MIMDYKLALSLKNAGFPQDKGSRPISDTLINSYSALMEAQEEPVYPSLSQLIEECGDDFRWLKRRGKEWMAQGRPHPVGKKEPKAWGETPEIAVANLWLILNRKDI